MSTENNENLTHFASPLKSRHDFMPTRWLALCCLAVLLCVIASGLIALRRQHDSTRIFNELLQQGDLIVLKNWTSRYVEVDKNNVPKVASNTPSDITLPDKAATTRIVSARGPNTDIVLFHELSPQELAWLAALAHTDPQESNVDFIAPRLQMSYATLQFQKSIAATRTGNGNFLLASINREDLRENPNFILTFKITNTPWFGPAQFPIVLARPSASQKFLNLEKLATAGELYTDIMTLTCALMLIAFACVFSGTPGTTWLAVYCAARALRIFVSYLFNAHLVSQDVALSLLAPVHFGLDIATSLALIGAVSKQSGSAIPGKYLLFLGGFFYGCYALETNSFFAPYWLNTSTTIGDLASGFFCMIALCVDGVLRFKARQTHVGPGPNGFIYPVGLALTLIACVLLTWGASEYLIDILRGRPRGIMSVPLALVMPTLIMAFIWNSRADKEPVPVP